MIVFYSQSPSFLIYFRFSHSLSLCCCPRLNFYDGETHQLLASKLLRKAIEENAFQDIRPVLDFLVNGVQKIAHCVV